MSRINRLALVVALVLCAGSVALADVSTWAGANANWNVSTNWSGGSIPASDIATDLVFGSAGSTAVTQNYADPFVLNLLTFVTGAQAFTFTGSQLQFGSAGPGLIQSSLSAQIINTALDLSNMLTISGTGTGGLTFGTASGGSSSITGAGGMNFTTTGLGVTISGTGNNTFSGTTTWVGGDAAAVRTLTLNKTGGWALGGDLVIGDGVGTAVNVATVTLGANNQLATTANVVIKSDGYLNMNNKSLTVGSLTMYGTASVAVGTGTLTLNGNVIGLGADGATSAIIGGWGNPLSLGGAERTFNITRGLSVTNTTDLRIDTTISNGSLTKTGNGTLYLNPWTTNTYTGTTTVDKGTLRVRASSPWSSTNWVIGNSTEGPGSATLLQETNSVLPSTATVTINPSGKWDLVTQGSVGQNLTNLYINGGQMILGQYGGMTVSGSMKFTNGGTLILGNSAYNSYPLIVSSQLLSVTGSAVPAYIGGIGTLELFVTSATTNPVGVIDVTRGTAATDLEIACNLSKGADQSNYPAGIRKTGNGILTLSGTVANSAPTGSPVVGSFYLDDGTVVLSKTGTPVANTAIPAAARLYVGDGTGTANTAVLKLAQLNQIGDTIPMTIASDGQFDLNGTTETIGSLIMTGGNVNLGSTGALTLGNVLTNLYSGSTITGSGTSKIVLANNVTVYPFTGAVSSSGGLDMGAAARTFNVYNGSADDDFAVSGIVSGTAGLTKTGLGKMVLSGNNIYLGTTTVSGPLKATNASALGSTTGALTLTSGQVEIAAPAGGTLTKAALSFAGNGQIGIDGSGGATTFTATSIARTGNGTFVFNPVTGSAGTNEKLTLTVTTGLGMVNAMAAPYFAIQTAGGATAAADFATYTGSGLVPFNNYYTGALMSAATSSVVSITGTDLPGALTIQALKASGSLNLTGTGALTLDGLYGAANFGGLILNGDVTIAPQIKSGASDNKELVVYVQGGANATLSGTIATTAGGLTVFGPGTVTLSGNNSFVGGPTINGATLKVGSLTAIPAARIPAVNTGGVLDLNGFAQTLGGITSASTGFNGGVVTNSGAQAILTLNVTGNQSFDGILTGNIQLNKIGGSTQTVTGSGGSITGPVNISAGSLVLTGFKALGTALNYNVNAGGNLTASADAVVASSTITVTGNGALPYDSTTGISVGAIQTAANAPSKLFISGNAYANFTAATAGWNIDANNALIMGSAALSGGSINISGTVQMMGYDCQAAGLTINEPITGSGALLVTPTRYRPGKVTLGGDNSGFTGLLEVDPSDLYGTLGVRLYLTNDLALGAGTNLVKGLLNVNGRTLAQPLIVDGGTVSDEGGSGATLTGTITILNNAYFQTHNNSATARTLTMSGKVTGSGTLIATGIGWNNNDGNWSTLALTNGANDYSGGTVVSMVSSQTQANDANGQLLVGAAGALGSGTVTVRAGRLTTDPSYTGGTTAGTVLGSVPVVEVRGGTIELKSTENAGKIHLYDGGYLKKTSGLTNITYGSTSGNIHVHDNAIIDPALPLPTADQIEGTLQKVYLGSGNVTATTTISGVVKGLGTKDARFSITGTVTDAGAGTGLSFYAQDLRSIIFNGAKLATTGPINLEGGGLHGYAGQYMFTYDAQPGYTGFGFVGTNNFSATPTPVINMNAMARVGFTAVGGLPLNATLNINSGGLLTLGGTNYIAGTVNVNSGGILKADANAAAGTFNINDGGVLWYNNNTRISTPGATWNWNLTGTQKAVVMLGASTLTNTPTTGYIDYLFCDNGNTGIGPKVLNDHTRITVADDFVGAYVDTKGNTVSSVRGINTSGTVSTLGSLARIANIGDGSYLIVGGPLSLSGKKLVIGDTNPYLSFTQFGVKNGIYGGSPYSMGYDGIGLTGIGVPQQMISQNGIVRLTNAANAVGRIDVQAGTLSVTSIGALGSATTVSLPASTNLWFDYAAPAAATLISGAGNIRAGLTGLDTLTITGTAGFATGFAPGGSGIGKFNLAGGLAFSTGSTLYRPALNLGIASTSGGLGVGNDGLAVTGTVNINNADLWVDLPLPSGALSIGATVSMPIITAASFSGTFANITTVTGTYSTWWNISNAVSYSGTGAVLSLGRANWLPHDGDFNYDKQVNGDDLTTLANNWMATGANWLMGDFTMDGVVNGDDLTVLANHWGETYTGGGAAVPEPASLALLGLGALALIRRRRK